MSFAYRYVFLFDERLKFHRVVWRLTQVRWKTFICRCIKFIPETM